MFKLTPEVRKELAEAIAMHLDNASHYGCEVSCPPTEIEPHLGIRQFAAGDEMTITLLLVKRRT